jgi:hypothetical protein
MRMLAIDVMANHLALCKAEEIHSLKQSGTCHAVTDRGTRGASK